MCLKPETPVHVRLLACSLNQPITYIFHNYSVRHHHMLLKMWNKVSDNTICYGPRPSDRVFGKGRTFKKKLRRWLDETLSFPHKSKQQQLEASPSLPHGEPWCVAALTKLLPKLIPLMRAFSSSYCSLFFPLMLKCRPKSDIIERQMGHNIYLHLKAQIPNPPIFSSNSCQQVQVIKWWAASQNIH